MTELERDSKNLENLGNMLKTHREINGLTRRDVVVKTKIPLEQLESIEDGRLSSLPPVFAKGFLRVYATELGLDAENILEDYRQMTGGFKNEPASREPLAPKYIETSVGSSMAPFIKLALLLLLIALALSGAFWISPAFRSAALSVFPSLGSASPEAGTTSTEAAPEARPEAAAAPAPQAESAPPPEPGDAGGALILTSQKDNVWAQVSVDGAAPEFHYFMAGQKSEFKATRNIVVTTGQASALSVNWNGNELGPLAEKTTAEVTFPNHG